MKYFVYLIVKKNQYILEVAHEGMVEVKRSKLNTLLQEYEVFRMKSRESILDL